MPQGNRYRTRLGVEQMEHRDVPSTAVLSGGVLTITGTHGSEYISVYQKEYNGVQRISVWDTPIQVDGVSRDSVPRSAVSTIHIYALGGNDHVYLDTERVDGYQPIQLPTMVRGGEGNDWI